MHTPLGVSVKFWYPPRSLCQKWVSPPPGCRKLFRAAGANRAKWAFRAARNCAKGVFCRLGVIILPLDDNGVKILPQRLKKGGFFPPDICVHFNVLNAPLRTGFLMTQAVLTIFSQYNTHVKFMNVFPFLRGHQLGMGGGPFLGPPASSRSRKILTFVTQNNKQQCQDVTKLN